MNNAEKSNNYNTGAEFWRDTLLNRGIDEATDICIRYLGMQLKTELSADEKYFCKDFQVTNKKIYTEKDYFKNILSENDYTRLDYLETLYTESGEMETIEAFKRGFEIAIHVNQ